MRVNVFFKTYLCIYSFVYLPVYLVTYLPFSSMACTRALAADGIPLLGLFCYQLICKLLCRCLVPEGAGQRGAR